jgi:hypothetical protein
LLSGSAWFACVCVNIFLTLTHWNFWVKRINQFRIACYVMSYGVPLIFAVLAAALKKLSGGGLTCIISSDANGWYVDGLFFVPLGIWVMSAVIAMLAVLIRIIFTLGFKSIRKQQRLLLFCAIFGYIGIYTIVFRIYTRAQTNAVTRSLTAYANCIVQGGVDCKPGTRFNATANFINNIHQVFQKSLKVSAAPKLVCFSACLVQVR